MAYWKQQQIAGLLGRGGIIAYPTEAVYGLGCDPFNPYAIERLLWLKHRDPARGLIVIGADLQQLEDLVKIPNTDVKKRLMASWPGPTTWVLPATDIVPDWLTGGRRTLAVRVTAHSQAADLCRQHGPLISTSANISRRPPSRNTMQVKKNFAGKIDQIINGSVGSSKQPSQIFDAISGRQLR